MNEDPSIYANPSGSIEKKNANFKVKEIKHLSVFSRMRSEGFPFIVGGLGVGPVFASCLLCGLIGVVVGARSTR